MAIAIAEAPHENNATTRSNVEILIGRTGRLPWGTALVDDEPNKLRGYLQGLIEMWKRMEFQWEQADRAHIKQGRYYLDSMPEPTFIRSTVLTIHHQIAVERAREVVPYAERAIRSGEKEDYDMAIEMARTSVGEMMRLLDRAGSELRIALDKSALKFAPECPEALHERIAEERKYLESLP